MRIVVTLVLILGFVVACAGDDTRTNESPQSAAEAFLSLIDQDDYQESWTEASKLLRDNVDANQWAEHAASYRQPLGIAAYRKLNSIEFHDSLEEMPAGDYALVFFDSSLADNGNASEMVGLVLDDNSVWRVIGYQTL